MANLKAWNLRGLFLLFPVFYGLGAIEYPAQAQQKSDEVKAKSGGYQEIYKWAPKAYQGHTPTEGPEMTQIGVAYDRSVEIRSMMAEFISQKIQRVIDAKDDQTAKSIMGDFCASDDIAKCKERFVLIYSPMLTRLKRGIEDDESNQAKLVCTQRNPDGTCVVTNKTPGAIHAVASPLPQPNYLPYVPTYTDLQQYAKSRLNDDDFKKKISPEKYKEWVKKMFVESGEDSWYEKNIQAKPIKEDFIKTKQVYKDPDNPDEGKLTIYETDAAGNQKYDEKAFNSALKLWKLDKEKFQNKDVGEAMKEKEKWKQSNWENHFKEFANEKKVDKKNPNNDYGIFADVRGPLVGEANKMTEKQIKQNKKGKSSKQSDSKTPTKSESPTPAAAQEDPQAVNADAETPVKPPTGLSGAQNSVRYNPESFSLHQVVEFHKDAFPHDKRYREIEPPKPENTNRLKTSESIRGAPISDSLSNPQPAPNSTLSKPNNLATPNHPNYQTQPVRQKPQGPELYQNTLPAQIQDSDNTPSADDVQLQY